MQSERESGVRVTRFGRCVPVLVDGSGQPQLRVVEEMCRAVLVRHIVHQLGRFDDDALRDVLVRLVAAPTTQGVAA